MSRKTKAGQEVIRALEEFIAAVSSLPDAPPPVPSDDVYLPGGLPWTKGEPCWGLEGTSGWRMVEYRTQTGTRIVPGIHRSPGTFRLADGQDIPATSVIRCTNPLPTGGE